MREAEAMRSGSGDMDGLNASLGPMLNYFNALEDDKLMDAVALFSRDIGFGSDYHICSFASNWHPQEEGFFESGYCLLMRQVLRKRALSWTTQPFTGI
jgi:hypothetical protein